MLPEIGATELLVIAAVALIVVGPKDLPILLRKVGQWVAKARGMANEFRASFDEMARQSELDELRREVQALRSGQFADPLRAGDDASKASVDRVFSDIESGLRGGDVQLSPASAWQPEAYAEPQPEPAPALEKPKRKRAPARTKADVAIVEEAAPARKPRAPRKKKSEAAS